MHNKEMEKEYLKPCEVAKILRVSTRTVINMIKAGRLVGIPTSGSEKRIHYRILAGELDRFAAREYEKRRKL